MINYIVQHPWIISIVILWSFPWKGAALWRAARRGHIGWFLTLLIVNTLAILDILYIFIFSNWGITKQSKTEPKEERRNPQIRREQPKAAPNQGVRTTVL